MPRVAQFGIALGALGIVLTLMGLFPGVTGMEPTLGIGITQISAILIGFLLLILGALIYDHSHESAEATGLADDKMGSVVSHGQVWMFTEQAVTPADPVFVRYNAAGGTGTSPAVGQVRKDADTAKAVAATNARFRTGAAAGGLVLVEWNVP